MSANDSSAQQRGSIPVPPNLGGHNDDGTTDNAYRELSEAPLPQQQPPLQGLPQLEQQLTSDEIFILKTLLARHAAKEESGSAISPSTSPRRKLGLYDTNPMTRLGSNVTLMSVLTADSDYPEFGESTHAWAVFADNPKKRAGTWERAIGFVIIVFQLFAYRLFAVEAISDYEAGQVPVTIGHHQCMVNDGIVDNDNNADDQDLELQCDAGFTDQWDAFVAFFMLGIFLTADIMQAARAFRDAPTRTGGFFALLAGIEVICAFLAAGIAVSYNLFIGEVTDAVEVGVGLLFIRELSQKTYQGLKDSHRSDKQYVTFFVVLSILVGLGLIMDPLCAKLFAGYIQ